MSVFVVEALEVIDIKHDQGQRSVLASGPANLIGQCDVQPPAVAQAGQAVSQCHIPHGLVGAANLFLHGHSVAQLAQHDQSEANEYHDQKYQYEAGLEQVVTPGGNDGFARQSGLDHQRISGQGSVAVNALSVVDDGPGLGDTLLGVGQVVTRSEEHTTELQS